MVDPIHCMHIFETEGEEVVRWGEGEGVVEVRKWVCGMGERIREVVRMGRQSEGRGWVSE